MKKPITPSKKKPIDILKIEELYEVELKQEKQDVILNDDGRKSVRNFFTTNENNEITGLSFNNLTETSKDLSLIKKLDKLIFLALTRNNIEDISLMFPLPNLKYLYLGGNKIKDISALTNSFLLEELAIWNNPISTVVPLKSLINLKKLHLQDTGTNNLIELYV
ncbi:leucine-rich repeat domain-containing protein [Polaribacter undariae]|uniref:Leucine-rich repeat domain-containing protein n=1 Tax=Polaribacter sejongensis TaxID=985043 RepID=A0AAJ1QYU6_9FLAO|nr:leucine-rich repeat domain-containing protein [Polaribacter undariae]MDN3620433.1 leucine-rich repeat domain-containing protein [Polaribacter undariae]UWD32832.1 leucine-rich repeat domain-containing protein [Polaribacter undariae]